MDNTNRIKGQWKALNIEPKVSAPLDARTLCPNIESLISRTWWGDTTFYQGMTVTIFSNAYSEPSIFILMNEQNPYSISSWFEIKAFDGSNGTSVEDSKYVLRKEANIALGYAKLDGNGKILNSQLPSYVSQIISAPTVNDFPNFGDENLFDENQIAKGFSAIYVDEEYRRSYRWVGVDKGQCGTNNGYVEISTSLVLGEILGTAYDGSRGMRLEKRVDSLEDIVGKYDRMELYKEPIIDRLEKLLKWHEA